MGDPQRRGGCTRCCIRQLARLTPASSPPQCHNCLIQVKTVNNCCATNQRPCAAGAPGSDASDPKRFVVARPSTTWASLAALQVAVHLDRPVTALHIADSPQHYGDPRHFLLGDAQGAVHVFDLAGAHMLQHATPHASEITALAELRTRCGASPHCRCNDAALHGVVMHVFGHITCALAMQPQQLVRGDGTRRRLRALGATRGALAAPSGTCRAACQQHRRQHVHCCAHAGAHLLPTLRGRGRAAQGHQAAARGQNDAEAAQGGGGRGDARRCAAHVAGRPPAARAAQRGCRGAARLPRAQAGTAVRVWHWVWNWRSHSKQCHSALQPCRFAC